MSANRLFQCIGILSLLALFGVEARAEPILLVEIHKHGFKTLNSIGEPVPLEFATFITDITTQSVFGGNFTDAQEGMAFDAPHESIPGFEAALTASTGRLWLTDGGHTPVLSSVDNIWDMPFGTYTTTPHVPRLGHGLTGYNLTRVTHTIEQLDYFTRPGPSGGPTAEIRQTISLYGEPIPEPASILLLTASCVFSWRLNTHGRRWL
jgi:hypothetical protein